MACDALRRSVGSLLIPRFRVRLPARALLSASPLDPLLENSALRSHDLDQRQRLTSLDDASCLNHLSTVPSVTDSPSCGILIVATPIFESSVPEANAAAIRRALAARSLRYVWTGTCASRSSFAVSS